MDRIRNKNTISIDKVYSFILGNLLSRDEGLDAELLTEIALNFLGHASYHRNSPVISRVIRELTSDLKIYDKRLSQNIFNCNFTNPIGLAAGFDKNAIAAGLWINLGLDLLS